MSDRPSPRRVAGSVSIPRGRPRTASEVLSLQLSVGNRATSAILARQAAAGKKPAAAAGGLELSQLRTIALEAIDMYETAADDGIADAVATVSGSGWGPFATALAGNLIWAAACFETGGAAFLISVAGIAVGSTASLPKSGPEFVTWAKDNLIKKIRDHLESQVDRVTKDVQATVSDQGWDDNRVRRELLGRLLKKEYIKTIAGGIPIASREAMRHRVFAGVLIRANRQIAEPFPLQNPGVVHYYYAVSGHVGKGYQYGDELEPLKNWSFAFKSGELTMEEGGAAAVAELKKDPKIAPAQMPFVKLVHIDSAGDDRGFLIITLDGQNKYFRKYGNIVFSRVDAPAVIAQLWRDTKGEPPEIETSKLK